MGNARLLSVKVRALSRTYASVCECKCGFLQSIAFQRPSAGTVCKQFVGVYLCTQSLHSHSSQSV